MLTSGFFNSVDGDRKYNAEQMSQMFEGLIGDGVFESVGGKFKVSANTGMTVSVATGRAVVDSKWVKSDSLTNVTLSASHISLPRYTIIVLRHVKEERRVILTAIDGTPASTPSVPAVVRDAQYYDICLAKIYVNAAVSSITDANITDTRADSDVCGYVTGLIEQVDTSDILDQWEAAYADAEAQLDQTNEDFSQAALSLMENERVAFMRWFDSLASTLRVDTYIETYEAYFKPASIGSHQYAWSRISGYTYNPQDVIIASINGLEAVRNYDYAVDDYSIDFFDLPTTSTADVHIKILKSRIGYNAEDVRQNVPKVYEGFATSSQGLNKSIDIYGDPIDGTLYLSVIGAFDSAYSITETVTENNSTRIIHESLTDHSALTSSVIQTSLIQSWGEDTITYASGAGIGEGANIALGAVYELPDFFGDVSADPSPSFTEIESKFFNEDNGRPKQIVIDPGTGTNKYILIAFSAGSKLLESKVLDDETVMRVNGSTLECLRAKLPYMGGMGDNAVAYTTENPTSEIVVGAIYASSYKTTVIELQFAKNADITGYILYRYDRA